jgi:hypothetical protein
VLVGVGLDFVLEACEDFDITESSGDLEDAESDACSLIDLSCELRASVSFGSGEARNRLDVMFEGRIRRDMLDLDVPSGMPDMRIVCQEVSNACDKPISQVTYSEGPESHCLTSGSRFTPCE